jgi:hypothetical protein
MTTFSRQKIFAQAAKKLRQDFGELSTVPHRALKGHEAEKLVRTFLAGHLPKRFGVGSGFIIDHNDSVSKQTDVIIYDAHNCPVYRVSDDAAIFPNENVAAVVEVKARLDREKLSEAAKNIAAAKSLTKVETPELPTLETTQTFGCVFAFKSSLSMATLTSHYAEHVRSTELGRQIDVILVLDRGVINLLAKPPGLEWAPLFGFTARAAPPDDGTHIAAAAIELGEDSLDVFLRFLLAQLIHFRSLVPHPGFDWKGIHSNAPLHRIWLATVLAETDPQRRAAKHKEYEKEVIEIIASSPVRRYPLTPARKRIGRE